MFSRIVYLVNEPNLWVSPCIWYENRGFGVYKAERLSNSICLAIVCPLPLYGSAPPFLPGSPFFLGWVLTSFVPPAHKQGGSSAFVWKKAVTKHQARLLEKTAFLVGDMT